MNTLRLQNANARHLVVSGASGGSIAQRIKNGRIISNYPNASGGHFDRPLIVTGTDTDVNLALYELSLQASYLSFLMRLRLRFITGFRAGIKSLWRVSSR